MHRVSSLTENKLNQIADHASRSSEKLLAAKESFNVPGFLLLSV